MTSLLVVLVGVLVLGGSGGDVSALLTIGQVAQRLATSRTTAWRLVASGAIPSVRITDTLRRVDSADLEAWIDERRERSAPASVVPLSRRSDS